MDHDTLDFGEEHHPPGILKHQWVVLFHLLFRTLAVLVYLFCGIFGSGFIGSFVVIVLLLSMDFWVVKNVTGRIMVGLRWWNYIDDDGNSHWVFEARKGGLQGRVLTLESNVFWASLVVTPVVWLLLAFTLLFSWNFRWMMIILIAVILSGSNLYGYIRCKIGKSEGLSGTAKNFASSLFQRQMASNVASYFSRAPQNTSPNTVI